MTLDRPALLTGAGTALAIAVPTALLGGVVTDDDQDNLVFVFFAVILAGLFAGGYVAARQQPDHALAHAALAAAGAFAVAQAIGVALRLARDGELRPAIYLFNLVLAIGVGALGGLAARRRSRSGAKP